MKYERYLAKAVSNKNYVKEVIEKSNKLRSEAGLPTYDVEEKLAEHPIKSKDEFEADRREALDFYRFRKKELKNYNYPYPNEADDWRQKRALAYTRHNIDLKIIDAWKKQKNTR